MTITDPNIPILISEDNVILYGRYVKGHHKGQGVRYSADRKEAQLVVDGVPKKTVSLSVAKDIVSDLLGLVMTYLRHRIIPCSPQEHGVTVVIEMLYMLGGKFNRCLSLPPIQYK